MNSKTSPADLLTPEIGVSPTGPHTAWATPNGMRAEVRRGSRVVKRFRGETAWSDAVRYAGDLNRELELEELNADVRRRS